MSGKGQMWKKRILPQYLPSQRRIFLCFMAKGNCTIYTSVKQSKGIYFFLSRGTFAKIDFRRVSSSFVSTSASDNSVIHLKYIF